MENKQMIIRILGTGCPNCIALEANTKEALAALGQDAVVDKVTDIEAIMGYGVMSTPALVIDDNVVCSGRVPDVAEVKTMLSEQHEQSSESVTDDCSCGGAC